MANNIQQSLDTLVNECPGVLYALLADYTNGMVLGHTGNTDLDLELLAAGTTEIVRSDMKAAEMQGNAGSKSEEILFSQKKYYHVIRHSVNHPGLYLVMGADRQRGNLALMRRKVMEMDQQMIV